MSPRTRLLSAGALLTATLLTPACRPPGSRAAAASATSPAASTYVAPGAKDQFYLFYSGGHSGQVYVAGLPSMRHIATIPVFARYPATGYGYDEESRKMLGEFTWGDMHHPGLSQTDGRYDGRWLFVNDNANNRVARIDLRDFKTRQILGPIPNSSGTHGSSFVTENTEYVLVATRFSIPLPKGRYADPQRYEAEFSGMVSGLAVDPKSGTLSVGWQILTPPFNWDLGSTGKGPSSGWAFWTSYNSEMAGTGLEANATRLDRDYAAIVNWRAAEQAIKDGKGTLTGGVPMIDPAKVPGVMYFLPVPKSPHGIDTDPSGRWIVASGKLQPVASVFDFEKIRQAIDRHEFTGNVRGVPVLNYEALLEGDVPVGLGPLHTQYDGKGNAYTSLFVESAVAKWRLPPWSPEDRKDLNKVVLDKIPVHYNIGHLVIGGSDTREPYGQYLVAMNKLSKGRHVSVGPSQPESSELIDITGSKMGLLAEAFTEPEPHFAQILKADRISPIEVYPKGENHDADAVWSADQTGITRTGNKVVVKMMAIRSKFVPDVIEAHAGDEITIHLTNVEQTTDMIHGLGIVEHDMNVVVDPGETKTVRFKANKTGVYPFYCTNFCSALHQEMQGYLAVKP